MGFSLVDGRMADTTRQGRGGPLQASGVFTLGKGDKSEAATKGGSHEILKRTGVFGAVWRL